MKLFICLLLVSSAFSAYVVVDPHFRADCTSNFPQNDTTRPDINEALSVLQSDTVIVLNEGCHEIRNFSYVRDLVNVTITGTSRNVVVTCTDGLGLPFITNTTNLSIYNVTIDKCGFRSNQSYLQDVLAVINNTIDMFYNIPVDSKVASIFVDITHFQMRSVSITNTQGVGVIAINILGNSLLQDTLFRNNKVKDSPRQIFCSSTGGGMFLLYDDYRDDSIPKMKPAVLSIIGSVFDTNENCGLSYLYTQPDSVKVAGLAYNITGSSALDVSIAQLTYPVTISIIDTNFTNNSGYVGGFGLRVFHGVHDFNITIEGCHFEDNDLAIGIQTNAFQPTKSELSILEILGNATAINTNNMIIRKTTVLKSDVGMILYAFQPFLLSFTKQDLLLVDNSTFSVASTAFDATSLQCYGFLPGILVHLNDIKVSNINLQKDGLYSVVVGAIQSKSLNITISGASTISDCGVPGLFASKSIININGTVSFVNNSATIGGAMYLHDSVILMCNNSALRFIRNLATLKGGAIFAETESIGKEGYQLSAVTYSLCILSFGKLDEYYKILQSKPNLENLNVSVSFINNTAPLGKSIYGSSLRDCTWIPDYNSSTMYEVFQSLPLSFIPSIDSTNIISTDAIDMVVTNSSLTVLPGQLVKLDVTAYDALNQSIPWVITSRADDNSNLNVSSNLGLSGYWLLPGNKKLLTNAEFHGIENSTSSFTLLGAINSYPRKSFNVTFGTCTVGFVFDRGQCICDSQIPNQINCHNDSFVIEIQGGFWFGSSPEVGYTYSQCSLDYCNANVSILTANTDVQCHPGYHRTGLVCGECLPNYSVAFGSNRCLQCSNAYLATILLFASAGMLLVFLITYLNITIADGYINGVIFFSNIVSVYQPFFTKSLKSKGYSYVFLLTSLVNMDIGFELCFYDGMTTLARSILNLMFPLYLFVLMIVITIVVKFSVKLSNITNSVPRAFATLFLLSFTNIGQTCVEIISYFKIVGTRSTQYGWYMNPNVPYLESGHVTLAVIATLILIGLLVIAVFLLFPPLLVLLRLKPKLLPLVDPFWSPFRPSYRFWLSMRLFIRIIAFILAYFVPYPTNNFFLGLLCIGLLKLHSEIINPFKGKVQNRIDQSFITCLVIVAFSSVFNALVTSDESDVTQAYEIIVVLTMLMAYVGFVIVFVIHMFLRFPKLGSLVEKTKEKTKRKFFPLRKEVELPEEDTNTQSKVLTTSISIYDNTALREPLLDDSF